MKTRIALGLMLLAHICILHAQGLSPNQVAENAGRKIKQYEQEFLALHPQKIYSELERLLNVIKRKGSTMPDLTEDDTFKATAYALALDAKRKLQEPVASYFWGRYNSRICAGLDADKNTGHMAAQCWAESLDSFKIGSEGGVPSSSLAIGLMYENGWGAPKSNYVAAEWYVKAANKYNSDGEREGALMAVEAAIRVVPDHPAANRLRAQLFKQ